MNTFLQNLLSLSDSESKRVDSEASMHQRERKQHEGKCFVEEEERLDGLRGS